MRKYFPPSWLMALILSVYGSFFLLSFHSRTYAVRADSGAYFILANNLRRHFVFSQNLQSPFNPELFRVPGYPLFLALIGAVNTDMFTRVVAAQCLIALGIALVAWRYIRKRATHIGAIVGLAVLALDLNAMLHMPLVLSETLLQLFIVLGLVGAVEWTDSGAGRAYVFSAIWWALASLIKPIALFIPLTIFAINIFDAKKTVLFLFISMSLPICWVMHNRAATGHSVYTIQGGYALLVGPAAGALAISEHTDTDRAVQILEERVGVANPGLMPNSLEESNACKREAVRVMKQYPWATFKYCVVGVFRILGGTDQDLVVELFGKEPGSLSRGSAEVSGSGTVGLIKRYPLLIFSYAGYLSFLLCAYVLFTVGCARLYLSNRKKLALLFLLPVLVLIAVACHQGYYRFRLPLMPFIAFAAAMAFRGNVEAERASRT